MPTVVSLTPALYVALSAAVEPRTTPDSQLARMGNASRYLLVTHCRAVGDPQVECELVVGGCAGLGHGEGVAGVVGSTYVVRGMVN